MTLATLGRNGAALRSGSFRGALRGIWRYGDVVRVSVYNPSAIAEPLHFGDFGDIEESFGKT